MTDYASFRTSNVTLPLTSSLSASILKDADPVMYYALDFWSWVITTEVGARLVAASTAAGFPLASAVAQRYPVGIDANKLQNQYAFPLLSVYRTGTVFNKKTMGYYDDRCSIGLAYILPPMTAAQAEQILPIFRPIEIALRDRTVQSWDPAYTPPGGTLGDSPWGAAYAYLEEIGWESSSYGFMQGMGDEFFPTLTLNGFWIERMNPLPLANNFDGSDTDVHLIAPDQTDFGTVVKLKTQLAPTITSFTATTGSHTGGTSVTITGTNYKAPAKVLFGSVPAASVTVASTTSITCTTPAMSGAGAVNVTVINYDGQSAVGATQFTFT